MVQYAEDKFRIALMEMWKLCFPADSDKFTAFYFDNVYRANETLVAMEGNMPVASLQIIPYRIKTGETICNAGYISGAMTHPAFRQRGYMKRLLSEAFKEMERKRFQASFLIPQESSLFEFYKKYGYRKAFPVYSPEMIVLPSFQKEMPGLPGINIYTSLEEPDIASLYLLYSRFLMQKENVVLKNFRQFSNILHNFFIDNGVLFAGEQGIAFCFPGENLIGIKEAFYVDAAARDRFLYFISSYFSINELHIFNAAAISVGHYSGMIKILDTTTRIPEDTYISMMLD